VKDGFKDTAELEKLLDERAISDMRKADIRRLIDGINKGPEETVEETPETPETPAENQETPNSEGQPK
jgi:hypothetical protein